jgi:hypothetical protein
MRRERGGGLEARSRTLRAGRRLPPAGLVRAYIKPTNYERLEVSKKLLALRGEPEANIKSDGGILLRVNRSIQVLQFGI